MLTMWNTVPCSGVAVRNAKSRTKPNRCRGDQKETLPHNFLLQEQLLACNLWLMTCFQAGFIQDPFISLHAHWQREFCRFKIWSTRSTTALPRSTSRSNFFAFSWLSLFQDFCFVIKEKTREMDTETHFKVHTSQFTNFILCYVRTHSGCSAKMTKDAFQPMRWSLCWSIYQERWDFNANQFFAGKVGISNQRVLCVVWVADNSQASCSQCSNENITVTVNLYSRWPTRRLMKWLRLLTRMGMEKLAFPNSGEFTFYTLTSMTFCEPRGLS